MLALLWHQFLKRLGLQPVPARRQYHLDEQYQAIIVEISHHQRRSEDEVHANLVASGIDHLNAGEGLWISWQSLSQRERDVAALICQGYSNSDIASRLGVSQTTVKTHIRHILEKFQLHGKAELRMALRDWDFK
jgi:ATP/maltotriose-dependent transcriptional regulator MalT